MDIKAMVGMRKEARGVLVDEAKAARLAGITDDDEAIREASLSVKVYLAYVVAALAEADHTTAKEVVDQVLVEVSKAERDLNAIRSQLGMKLGEVG